MGLGHKLSLAGESILQGLRRWSRLAERCTQARRPRPAGAALCLFSHPVCVVFFIWCLVCLCWRSCDSGKRRRGKGCGAGPRRACLQLIDAGRSAPPFLQSAPPSTAHPRIVCDRHPYQQWCARGGAGQQHWRMGAWSRGGSVNAHARASTQAMLMSGNTPANCDWLCG